MATMGEKILDFLSAMNTHSRYPDSSRDEAYTRSYRVSRLVVGFLGILLPIIFIIGEALFLRGGVHVRGSLSEYYHTSMQDIFVGGLCVIGFLLATYMAGEARTWDFWASLIAGVAVLGSRLFPHHAVGPARWRARLRQRSRAAGLLRCRAGTRRASNSSDTCGIRHSVHFLPGRHELPVRGQ